MSPLRQILSRLTGRHGDASRPELIGAQPGLEWSLGEQPIIVAPEGTAHSRKQDPRIDALRVEDGCVEVESHRTPALPGHPVHMRRVRTEGEDLLVTDRVEGGAGAIASALLLLHPAVLLEPTQGGLTLHAGGARALLGTHARVSQRAATWTAPDGTNVPTTELVLEYGPAPCFGSFRLTALAETAALTDPATVEWRQAA